MVRVVASINPIHSENLHFHSDMHSIQNLSSQTSMLLYYAYHDVVYIYMCLYKQSCDYTEDNKTHTNNNITSYHFTLDLYTLMTG